MEKTKKLFMYAVVFVAIVSLFVAGIVAQTVPSYADGATAVPSWQSIAVPAVKTDSVKVVINGAEQEVTAETIKDFVTLTKVADTDAPTKEKIENFIGQLTGDTIDAGLKNKIDDIAKAIDPAFDRSVMEIAYTFEVKPVAGASVELTFPNIEADVVLFKGYAEGSSWEILYPASAKTAANAAGIYAANNGGVTIEVDKPGVVVMEKVGEKAAQEAKSGNKTEAKCTCCSENCPFCSFLCKDGKCYCWSMYVVIVLGAILIVLLIALIIVKAKAKKVVNVQAQPAIEEPEVEEEKPAEEPKQEETNNDQQ